MGAHPSAIPSPREGQTSLASIDNAFDTITETPPRGSDTAELFSSPSSCDERTHSVTRRQGEGVPQNIDGRSRRIATRIHSFVCWREDVSLSDVDVIAPTTDGAHANKYTRTSG
jgi:hypothetical protein